MDIADRAYGVLAGLALGDAAGMPFEMLNREKIKALTKDEQLFYQIPEDHFLDRELTRAEVTDDTLLTLHLANFLIDNHANLSKDDYYYSLAHFIKDKQLIEKGIIGPSTTKMVKKILQNENFSLGERAGFSSGLPMKITPLGIIYSDKQADKILAVIEEIAYYSHYTDTALSAAAGVAAFISAALSGKEYQNIIEFSFKLMEKAEKLALKTFQPSTFKRTEFLFSYLQKYSSQEKALDFISQVMGTGINSYEVVPAALAVFDLYLGQPIKAIKKSIALGGDTDTITAILGSFIGAYYGIDVFETEWLQLLNQVNDNLELKETANLLLELREL
ncbi:ADP-ribosylglycohydrolase family protein [Halanaerobium sp. Z-7514]|uniref:ADP-ribosylglycohydrolase family protein n=1 Tax=Halanaerobium polyolivorans TaxID=2886943 RepID=A0AAW4WYQ0_9FIRM|nr:ADP-ribosylglycohydrolase family protein [Halanaerobium polyolivorans]MCC3144112.1 ADP-ribosylglycohydrolase family protein [Halanaerobium polyolivorans]